MPYVIITKYKPGGLELQPGLRPEHLEYLTRNKNRILAAGGMIEDDGTGGSGGVIIVDTDDRAEAEAFIAEDPYTKGGLFESTTVKRWRKAFFDGERLV